MARNFYMDYSNNNPKLMDGDTGLEVGAEPKKDNNIKKLQQLKEFGKNPHVKAAEPKPMHILRHIDKVKHEVDGGPEPKSNEYYHKKHPYDEQVKKGINRQDEELNKINGGTKADKWTYESWADGLEERTRPKPDTWELMKQTSKSPQEIREIRDTINRSVKNMGTTKYLSKDELKYVDKKPEPIKPLAPISWDLEEPVMEKHVDVDIKKTINDIADAKRDQELADYDRNFGTKGITDILRNKI